MQTVQLDSQSVAESILAMLELRGVEVFIAAGTGTDFPPFVEAYARRERLGLAAPRPIVGIHEIPAVAMAHGYAAATGRPAFVMLHTIVGSANGVMGVINAKRARIPMLVASGRSAITERGDRNSRTHVVHWAQEAYDQQAMFREFVDWAYELRRSDQLTDVLERAVVMAKKSPAGPIHLLLPIEVISEPPADLRVSSEPAVQIPTPTVPIRSELERVVQILSGASNPIVITSAAGRREGAVAALVELTEKLALPVYEFSRSYLSFPQDHPLHQGFDPGEVLAAADVVMVIESDVPWIPIRQEPSVDATVIVLDEDPLYRDYPHRGFRSDIALSGDVEATLLALSELLDREMPGLQRVAERYALHNRAHEAADLRAKQVAEDASHELPIEPVWISRCLAECLQPTDIAISEFVLAPDQMNFTEPGTFFDHAHSGGLGWSLGAALGVKLAHPERTVVCCCGDGTYTFGAPVATHHMSALHGLPVLFVIFNNAAWDRTRMAVRGYAPEGYSAERTELPLCELDPTPDYERICEAAGGHGERVEDPSSLPAALERALRVVREEGRQALVNVISSKS